MSKLVHEIVRRITENSLFFNGDRIVVGISGGADSTALLHILASCNLNLQLTAVYVDHQLRPEEAITECESVAQLAASTGVKFFRHSVNVPRYREQHGYSVEESARILRYQILEKVRRETDSAAIAVGHTADDQVEEFFIRLIRGAGLKGLCGMTMRHNHVVRPLLKTHRQQLLKYIDENNLSFCHDSSNDDIRFLRNRVRHQLLPVLEADYNPSLGKTILQTCSILAEDENLLDHQANDAFAMICSVYEPDSQDSPPIIDCRLLPFSNLHPALQRRVVEKICWRMGSRPSFRQINGIQDLLANGRSGQRQHLKGGLRMRVDQEVARFSHPLGKGPVRGDREVKPSWLQIEKCGDYYIEECGRLLRVHQSGPVDLVHREKTVLAVNGDLIGFPLIVRTPEPGETFRPLNAPGRKKISRILSDAKIPQPERPAILLVEHHKEPVALLGHAVAHAYKVTPATSRVLLLEWIESDPSPSSSCAAPGRHQHE